MWGGTWNTLPDSIADQPFTIKYFVSDTLNGRHGVGDVINGTGYRYEIIGLLNFTDGNGQPASIEFKVPDHLYKIFMDYDTTAQTPFEFVGYDLNSNPQKLDSILNNIHDVMVLPDFETHKKYMAQMNETTPYTGQGQATNTTLENITNGGASNPEIFTMLMEDHYSCETGNKPEPTGGPSPKGDGDIKSKVFETDKGPATVTYFMPEETVTYPGATVVNNYQVTTQAGEMPKLTVDAGGLEYTITPTQVNDTVFDVALAVKTPEGVQNSYNITVDIEGTPVTTTETPSVPFSDAQNAPNPFTSSTTLRYSLNQADNVDIVLYDMQGREVQTIYEGKQTAGTHAFVIDGSGLKDGVIFANIRSDTGGSHAVKLVVRTR